MTRFRDLVIVCKWMDRFGLDVHGHESELN